MKLPPAIPCAVFLAFVCLPAFPADPAAPLTFLVTNNDVAGLPSSATFYALGANGGPAAKTVVPTGGQGTGGGFFAANRVAVLPANPNACVFVSDAGTNDIAGIEGATHTLTGNFLGSVTDSGVANGIGLVANAKYLYASFTTTSTIATFQVETGCKLSFIGDTLAVGLSNGLVGGMALHGDMLIVTYGDGSLESFNVSAGTPVSNGDVQNSTGSANDHHPNGIDITQDGHFAIFGDASTRSTVEVSDISSGKLTATVPYELGYGWNSGNVRLSPDETVLYVANESGGRVTAAFFDKTSGKITPGCTSIPLKNFYTDWNYVGGVGLQRNTGIGGLIYVPEFGSNGTSSFGVMQIAVSGTTCTLTEETNSPIVDKKDRSSLLSIGVYPPRVF